MEHANLALPCKPCLCGIFHSRLYWNQSTVDAWAPSLNGLNRVPLEPNRPANTHNELDHTVCKAHVIHLCMLCWIVGYIKCVWIFNSILTQWSFRSLKPSLFRTAIRVPLTFVINCHGGWWHGDVLGSGIHWHYSYVIMGAMASQITSPTIVDSTVYSGADKKKYSIILHYKWFIKSTHWLKELWLVNFKGVL